MSDASWTLITVAIGGLIGASGSIVPILLDARKARRQEQREDRRESARRLSEQSAARRAAAESFIRECGLAWEQIQACRRDAPMFNHPQPEMRSEITQRLRALREAAWIAGLELPPDVAVLLDLLVQDIADMAEVALNYDVAQASFATARETADSARRGTMESLRAALTAADQLRTDEPA